MGKRDEILSLFPDGLKGRMKPVLEVNTSCHRMGRALHKGTMHG